MRILVPTEIKPKGFYYGMHNCSLETVPQSKISAKRSQNRGLYRKIRIHFSKISNHGTSSLFQGGAEGANLKLTEDLNIRI